jgi:phospholipid/cholesterol/gamma-HCH transport system substrate-binding protein
MRAADSTMSKRAPSTAQLLAIVGFALSCFGILLFLWITFGGPTPFKAKSYELNIPFNEATQLAEQSDVRISGVSVGKVQSIGLTPNGKQALATIALENRYAPIPEGSRAVLRTKTLLGETYVELTPSDGESEMLADGGTLPAANVAESVQLDEIFRTFNPQTRAAFQTWMRDASLAIAGRGGDLSYALSQLEPFFTEFDKLFRVLDTQRRAVSQLFSNGAVSLRALRGREGELASLIDSSNAVFQTTAARNREIEALFRAFPTFLDESKLTLERLEGFARNADPVIRQLVPAAEELSPTLIAFSRFAPHAKGFFEGLGPVIDRAPTGFPALRRFFRDEFPPFLRALDPFLRNLNPIVSGAALYKNELTAAMANVAAIANGRLPTSNQVHYLRALPVLSPESLSTYPRRLTSNRNSAYSQPLAGKRLAEGLLSFDTRQCSSGAVASLNPESAKDPAFKGRVEEAKRTPEENEKRSTDFFDRLKKFAFAGQDSSASVPAPGCAQQPPFNPLGKAGPPTAYQHAFEQQGD